MNSWSLDANLECTTVVLLKNFTITDTTVLTGKAIDALKPRTVNACYKPSWGKRVSDFRVFRTINAVIKNIQNVAKHSWWGTLFEMTEDDVKEHTEEQRETLTN